MSLFGSGLTILKTLTPLPPWLNLKWIAMWLTGLAFLALVWSWNERGHQVQRLADFQHGIIVATSEATVEPDEQGKFKLLKPEEVAGAITRLRSSYTSARASIVAHNRQTIEDKRKADQTNLKLNTQLALFAKQYAVANRKITSLENRPPVAPEQVCKTIEQDTNSAWDGWKQ